MWRPIQRDPDRRIRRPYSILACSGRASLTARHQTAVEAGPLHLDHTVSWCAMLEDVRWLAPHTIAGAPCQALAFATKLKAAIEWFSSTRMRKANKSQRTLLLSCLLVGSSSVSAQDGRRAEDAAPYLGASEVAFEWQYSCSGGKACSFSCPGSGGASNVTALTLQLGTIPLSGNQRAFGIFYKFSTVQIQRANGFSLTTGISTLSCQVNGMDLDYSGPRKSVDSSAPTAGIPSQESKSRAQLR